MEKVKLPSNFQIGERVGLQGLIDLFEESKDGKVVAANFTDQKVKYTLSIPNYRNGVELGHIRVANIDSALINVPFDNEFHYNSKRDIQSREDQGKPSVPMVSVLRAEERIRELSVRVVSQIHEYLDGRIDRIQLVEFVRSIMSVGLGTTEKAA